MDPRPIWPYLVWGARVLVARGQVDEAIAYVRARSGSTTSEEAVARFAEDALLKGCRRAEAFDQYALLANQANSNLSTSRALAKKYPELAPDRLLDPLIASTPAELRWQPCTGCRWGTATSSPASTCWKPTALPPTPPGPSTKPTTLAPPSIKCLSRNGPCRSGCVDRSAARHLHR